MFIIGKGPDQLVASMARSAPVVEPFANISAQELLKNTPGLFGWVRKEETAGIRSMVKALDCKYWKSRTF